MSAMRKMTIEIPEGLASEIDAKIASGLYADIDQLFRESVQAHLHPDRYRGNDRRIERWLVEEVGPTYDAYKADPGSLLSEDQAFTLLDELASKGSAKA